MEMVGPYDNDAFPNDISEWLDSDANSIVIIPMIVQMCYTSTKIMVGCLEI